MTAITFDDNDVRATNLTVSLFEKELQEFKH
jgi:hypothetical protein